MDLVNRFLYPSLRTLDVHQKTWGFDWFFGNVSSLVVA